MGFESFSPLEDASSEEIISQEDKPEKPEVEQSSQRPRSTVGKAVARVGAYAAMAAAAAGLTGCENKEKPRSDTGGDRPTTNQVVSDTERADKERIARMMKRGTEKARKAVEMNDRIIAIIDKNHGSSFADGSYAFDMEAAKNEIKSLTINGKEIHLTDQDRADISALLWAEHDRRTGLSTASSPANSETTPPADLKDSENTSSRVRSGRAVNDASDF